MAFSVNQVIKTMALEKEEKINIQLNSCRAEKNPIIKNKGDFLELGKSKTLKNNNAGEYEKRQLIKCIMEKLFSRIPNDNSIAFNAIFDINPRPYSDENPETLIAYLRYKNSPSKTYNFIVKTVIDHIDTSSLLHEASTGILATNKLKKLIPNFAYTYILLTHCNDNMFGSRIKFCFKPGFTRYLINENIPHDFSLSKLLKAPQKIAGISQKDVFGIFIQIFNALSVALEKTGFCHYDLHDENILIKKLDKPMHIKNYLSEKRDYITVNYLASIIDFEHSTYIYESKRYCLSQYLLGERYTEIPNPVFDYYKLLMNAYYSVDTGKNKKNLLPVMDLLFQFSDDLLFKGKIPKSSMKKEYNKMFLARKKNTSTNKILGSATSLYKSKLQNLSNDQDNTFMGVISKNINNKNKDFSYKGFYKNITKNYPELVEEKNISNKEFLKTIYNRKEQLK